jgi:myo-inositol-1(or 4)-monophosphatase
MATYVSDADLLTAAIAAVECGGNHATRNWNRRKQAVKTFAHDIKLDLDIECQEKIEQQILAQFPGHKCLGEEDASLDVKQKVDPAAQGYEWIIDPIDGTVNFSNGLPTWCCSVAVREIPSGIVRAGAVYAPMLQALYSASLSGTATKNGQPIHVSACTSLSQGIVMTGMDKNLEPGLPPLTYFRHIAVSARKARINGSAALDLCWVAEGAADGYFEGSIYLWDIAAAGLITERAGGQTEILKKRGEPNQLSFLASNGHIHQELRQVLQQAEA